MSEETVRIAHQFMAFGAKLANEALEAKTVSELYKIAFEVGAMFNTLPEEVLESFHEGFINDFKTCESWLASKGKLAFFALLSMCVFFSRREQ